jgi:hypothetical protein
MIMMSSALLPVGALLLLRRGCPFVVLLVATLTLIGCQPSIEVLQPASPLPPPTVAPDERALAIMGVDFDPPLEAGKILNRGGVTLLVALENRGRQTEQVARVTARLYDPDSPLGADLANETITVRSLAPGELRIVRFTQVNDLPVRSHYKLAIEVSPVPGERELDDNVHIYDILVHQAE